jgi:hypothetical protein
MAVNVQLKAASETPWRSKSIGKKRDFRITPEPEGKVGKRRNRCPSLRDPEACGHAASLRFPARA